MKKTPQTEPLEEHEEKQQPFSQWQLFLLLLPVIWLLVYFLYYFSLVLPNNPTVSRWDMIKFLPEALLENVAPIKEKNSAPSGVQFLPQRLGFLAIQILVLSGAWGFGHLILRRLGIDDKNDALTNELERSILALGLGLAGFSLITLLLGYLGLFSQVLFILIPVSFFAFEVWNRICSQKSSIKRVFANSFSGQIATPKIIASIILVPFLIAMLLGAMLPSIDFDVKEYHLQGPKEYLQNGHISMLPHNMYTSFPFLTEMLTLMGMVIYSDWYWGALAGKAILMSFAPLTALTLFAMVRRYFNERSAWFAAIIYLTTPWTYRISIIAYTEGALCFFLAITLFATMLATESFRKNGNDGRWFFMVGLFSGSAMATKYPGLISVGIPLCGFSCLVPFLFKTKSAITPLFSQLFSQSLKIAGLCTAGVLVTFGPWMAKNFIETGNPVYPLVYSVFGGVDWDPILNEKFRAGHRPDSHSLQSLWNSFLDVTFKNDWLSPLLFGLAPFAFLSRSRKRIGLVALYLGWFFATWWVLTHRIDRFWVPLIPIVALLGGVGLDAVWSMIHKNPLRNLLKPSLGILIGFALAFNLGFITTPLCGYNSYLIDLNESRERISTQTIHAFPKVLALNKIERDDRNVLCVGEAQVFDATYPLLYNTVFDYNLFEKWCGIPDDSKSADLWKMKETSEIRKTFQENRVGYLLVNWQEVLRYRLTYGYTQFVTPKRFEELQKNALIGPALNDPRFDRPLFHRPWEDLNNTEQKEIQKWAPELIVSVDGKKSFVTTQYFLIINTSEKSK